MSTQTKRKPLYHSELRTNETTTLQIKSDIKEGQYGPYCFVRTNYDDGDRLLNIENEACRRAIQRAPQDVWLELEAAGDGEGAFWDIRDATGGPVMPGADTEPVTVGGLDMTGSTSDSYFECLCAAEEAVRRFQDELGYPPSDEAIRIATTLYIQANR